MVTKNNKRIRKPTTEKNLIAQRLIKVMEKPPHLTDEDVEVLQQSIEERKISLKFDSPFEPILAAGGCYVSVLYYTDPTQR